MSTSENNNDEVNLTDINTENPLNTTVVETSLMESYHNE